jgi:hypothetical protein
MYLAFDLDATLGDFLGVWKILCTLRQDRFYIDSPALIKPYPSEDFRWKIDIAYTKFISEIAKKELSQDPLGLLRPGIFDVFDKVVRLKKAGICEGVIIYSNNGSIVILELVRDIFHRVFKYKIFDDLIHVRHRLRTRARGTIDIRKNWDELKRIFVEGECKANPGLNTSDVKFFDDQVHPDLVSKLGSNYIHITPYIHIVNIKLMIALFKKTLEDTDLLSDPDFLPYVEKCSGSNNLEDYFRSIERTIAPSLSRPPAKNASVKQMINALNVRSNNSNNSNYNLSKILSKTRRGGKRKWQRLSMKNY